MEAKTKQYVIIVAGGSGSRMKTELPKQFLPILGVPILIQTIRQFFIYDAKISLILVLPSKDIQIWDGIVQEFIQQNVDQVFNDFLSIKIEIVAGGSSRFQSVKNGLEVIKSANGLVAVHDGVRPFVSQSIINQGFETAQEKGNAITVVSSKDSLRLIGTNGDSKSLDRNLVRLVQTPQTFRIDLLKKAYQTPEQAFFTDDASVVENIGEKIYLIEGRYDNIKITTPEDLALAEIILGKMNQED